ncbi:MAG TPA: aminotransferase class V-fold PLP-dependent enzyme [Ktedonobacterales bacterium]|jgi:kynureninase
MSLDVSPNATLLHPELEAYRAEFPILQRKTYLNSCSLGALSQRSIDALHRFTENWNEYGAHAWYKIWLNEIAQVKEKFARVIGAKPGEVAIAPSVSAAVSELTSALDFSKRNRVVMADMDFPTLAYQWLVRQRLGVTVDFVASPDHIHVPPELLIEKIDERTALVATSRVFYTSGYVQNVAAVVEAAHAKGAYVLIDDYQGTGQIPIDVHALHVDFLVTGTLKWLMGGPGLALVYVREGLIPELQPTMTGWFANRDQFQFNTREFHFRDDAGRFESGTPALPTIHTASGGLEMVLEIGVQRIHERTRALTNDLIERVQAKGWPLRSPEKEDQRSAIVMLALDRPDEIVEQLVARRFIVDYRPGLVRVSPYFYNTVAENEAIVEEISQILAARR